MTPSTLHLTNAWHPASGGIRTFYRALIERAVEEGRRMAIVVPSAQTAVERIGATGRIYHLRAPRSPVFDTRYRLLLPHRYVRPSVSAIWRVIAREQPAIVEICDKYALPDRPRARGRQGSGPSNGTRRARARLSDGRGSGPVRRCCRRSRASWRSWVHPNPREPFGIGPLEAMTSGTAVIAARGGGVLEFASPRNAWLAEPSPEAFAKTLSRALREHERREARIREGLATAASLAWPDVASRMLALYDRIHDARLPVTASTSMPSA